MKQAAIYVRDPLTKDGNIISKDDQETACRDYCLARGLTVSATFRDTPGSRDEFRRMISEATQNDSPLDFIVVWKLNRFSMSLEGQATGAVTETTGRALHEIQVGRRRTPRLPRPRCSA